MDDLSLSVVIPAYNAAGTIGATLESMHRELEKAAARFPEFSYEIIVVNDGSTDGTPEVVEAMAFPHVRLFSKENTGVSDTRNFGLQQARNTYLWYFDADDLLFDDSVPRLVEFLQHKPDLLKFAFVAEDIVTRPKIHTYNNSVSADILFNGRYADFLLNNTIGYSSCGIVVRREYLISSGNLFNTEMSIGEDVVWNMSLAIKYPDAKIIVTNLNAFRYIVNVSSAVNTSSIERNNQHLDSSIKLLTFIDDKPSGLSFMQRSCEVFRLLTVNQIITRFLSCKFEGPELKKRTTEILAVVNASGVESRQVKVFRRLAKSPLLMRTAQFLYRNIFLPYIKPHIPRN